MKCAIYARTASDSETNSYQIEQCKKFITQNGWELKKVYQDIGPGLSQRFTAQRRLIIDAYVKGFDWVVTTDISRISKDPYLAKTYQEALAENGTILIPLNDLYYSINFSNHSFFDSIKS